MHDAYRVNEKKCWLIPCAGAELAAFTSAGLVQSK